MAGRKPKQVHTYFYSKSNKPTMKGRYGQKAYSTIADFRRDIFGEASTIPLFAKKGVEVFEIDVEGKKEILVASLGKLKQNEIGKAIKRKSSKLLLDKKPMQDKINIEMLNLDGEVLAVFRNSLIACKIMGIEMSALLGTLDCVTPYKQKDYTFRTVKKKDRVIN